MNELVKFLVEGEDLQIDEQALHDIAVTKYNKAFEEGIIHNLVNLDLKHTWTEFKMNWKEHPEDVMDLWRKDMKPQLVKLINEYKDIKLDNIPMTKAFTAAEQWQSIYLLDQKEFNMVIGHLKNNTVMPFKLENDMRKRSFDNIFGGAKKVGDFMKCVNLIDSRGEVMIKAAREAEKRGKNNKTYKVNTIAFVISCAISDAVNSMTRAIHSAR